MISSCKKEEQAHSRYEINAEYMPKSSTLTGTVKVTFENVIDNEISLLKFQLYPNAYRENALYSPVSKAAHGAAYYDGESFGEMVISSVNGAKSWEVMGEDENILYAYLERSLFPGDKVVLDIGFMVKLAKTKHATGICPKTVNLGNFFPILCGIKNGGFAENVYYDVGDPFYSDYADYTLVLKTPKDYVVASSGELVGERTLESKKEHTMSLTNARNFAVVLSQNYRVEERDFGEKTLLYYYYADDNVDKTMGIIEDSFSYYEKTFGEYPYSTYSVAQTGLCCAAMEFPAISFLSDGLNEKEKVRAVAHETAHQWWYAAVGSDSVENAWQDEGVAEYSALTFFEEYEKYDVEREAAVAEALKEYRSYYDVYGSVLGRADTRMTRHLKEFISEYEYQCLSVNKAVVMLDTLRKSVGDEKFFAALKKYYANNRFKNATPADFIAAFERCGLDVGGFFDSFLNGKGIL
jgi:hypothetical protein